MWWSPGGRHVRHPLNPRLWKTEGSLFVSNSKRSKDQQLEDTLSSPIEEGDWKSQDSSRVVEPDMMINSRKKDTAEKAAAIEIGTLQPAGCLRRST